VTPFLDPAIEPDASAKLEEVERVVGRILAEITDARPHVECESTTRVWLDGLSARQNEVLRHVLAGHDSATTARRLHLSVHTVRNHRQAILRQVGVHSQAELIAWWHARAAHPSGRAAS
jgi:DNA-binding CsgD family transcriptional regulator